MVNDFSGNYKILSNFYPSTIYFEGKIYPTVEHAYQAAKTKDQMIRHKISLLNENQAGHAKRLGRKVKLRKDWEIIKISIMKRLLIEKFTTNKNLKQFLLHTNKELLVEGNYWHDNYWGDCYCKKCENVKGLNQLGKLLMKVRDTIK